MLHEHDKLFVSKDISESDEFDGMRELSLAEISGIMKSISSGSSFSESLDLDNSTMNSGWTSVSGCCGYKDSYDDGASHGGEDS